MKPVRSIIAGFLVTALVTACQTTPAPVVVVKQPGFKDLIKDISDQIGGQEAAAISYFYDVENGDVTELGNLWRDRTAKALRDNGVTVKARRDIGILIEDAESYGAGIEEKEIWQKAGAQVVVCGIFQIIKPLQTGGPHNINLIIKAFRLADSSLVQSVEWKAALTSGWFKLHSAVKGNLFHEKLEGFKPPPGDNPTLSARLDGNPACYVPGSPGKIHVTTETGVHLYLLNLVADGTVTLLYPNRYLKDQPLTSSRFEFPPPVFKKKMRIVFHPLKKGESCRESIKVVASRRPLDFSFLPQPINRLYVGAEGVNIKKMRDVLKMATDWQEQTLPYVVGDACK